MRTVTLDVEMFNPDMVSDEAWERIKTKYLGKTFDLDSMTPTEKDEFDKFQDLVNFCRDREKKRGLDPVYARVSEAEWEGYRKRGQARMLREAQREKDSEIASLKEEVNRLSQDRTYWQSRTKVLTDILQKVAPDTVRTQDRINAEFMAKMVREEAITRVRNDEYKKGKIAGVKDWGSPKDIFQMLQSCYVEEFPDVLSRPLDPDGQEPWWQRYVKMVRDRSPSDRTWVENIVNRRGEVITEWRERTRLFEALTDRTKLYLESVLWDVPAPSQELIKKTVAEIDSGAWKKVDWKTLEPGSDSLLQMLFPDRLGANISQIQDDYARSNAKAWLAAAELYLKKYAAVERGEMTRLADFVTGYTPKEKVGPIPQDPERFEFSGSGPGM
ncbi:hypothetical protein [Leptospirillum ferriphilum]|uniref:Uncharacterized protein n=1 Tax=Leptospirillum ferriphilum TaxID=178606 RepID=A0A1V3SWJ4_9BACT|nr:hypothetical protein [Leptospirillum ferriphilum]OOH72636.1 hypothetical protein BOX24_06460 [Leptospirillum ferriphilum]